MTAAGDRVQDQLARPLMLVLNAVEERAEEDAGDAGGDRAEDEAEGADAATLTPARRAASGLPPTAYMWRPNCVRSSRSVQATSTARTSGRTHGHARDAARFARLTLQMATTAIPAAPGRRS